ncbi:uncharacterized protein N0V89_012286 [Didymosphaeria variabile]|uniref:PEBP-like protein n=1 Tax=Didymosphaeria variabile TaxID=1932322 RepID=A0A9W8X8Y8_9PLEO|nr:uncharacterized protein N0V89_012286 [Didymosphaeria variabile]KAJ4344543.1 hypothetical protein N0V89_012286 [Didymosphaeria variabile]
MLFTTLLSGLLILGGALAQTTPPGFTPAVNKTLDVIYNTQVITPGLLVKKSSTCPEPGTPRGTVLHALLQDWAPNGQTQNGSSILTTKATGPASYFGPAPPAETPKHPHNYIFLLHQQPDNFAVPAAHKTAVSGRMAINWPKFITDAGLSEPIAANYLQVQSGDNTKSFVA